MSYGLHIYDREYAENGVMVSMTGYRRKCKYDGHADGHYYDGENDVTMTGSHGQCKYDGHSTSGTAEPE